MSDVNGDILISQLLMNPNEFYDSGTAYELLQEYFNGYPINTLIPLIQSENKFICRTAIWITSELGLSARELIVPVSKRIIDPDVFISCYAMEIIANCASEERLDVFLNIFNYLNHTNQKVRLSLMNIISNLSTSRIQEAYNGFNDDDHFVIHKNGMEFLLDENRLTINSIYEKLNSNVKIEKKYGIIAAKRGGEKFYKILLESTQNLDEDIAAFSENTILAKKEFNKIWCDI